MKSFIFFLSALITCSFSLFGQKHDPEESHFYPEKPSTFHFVEYKDHALLKHVTEEVTLLADTIIYSQTGSHEHYSISVNDYSIFNAHYSIHRFKNTTDVQLTDINYSNKKYLPNQNAWLLHNGELVGVIIDTLHAKNDISKIQIKSDYISENYSWYLGAKSQHEAATGNVFMPDPVTTANTTYGGAYRDFDDSNTTELSNELKTANLEVTEENGVYILKNDFVEIREHSPPTIPPVTNTSPEFNFNRSESGFEDVNVLYHITEYQKYVQSIGFTNLANFPIPCDAHGFNGQDQSAFIWSPQQLIFGEGGVDDAEDADVIIHEYGHVLSFNAAPNTVVGNERRALDEALGDYMAASYSKTFSELNYWKVFNWDGHNEFWPGRLASSNDHYPEDLANNLYEDAPLWSATILDIELNIGRDITHKILFESMYSWFPNMTMTDAALLFIRADSNLNNGVNYPYISHLFLDRGFIDSSTVSRPDDIVLNNNMQAKNEQAITFLSSNPSSPNSVLRFTSNQQVELSVYSLQGKKVLNKTFNKGVNQVVLPNSSGMYLFQFVFANGSTQLHKQIIR